MKLRDGLEAANDSNINLREIMDRNVNNLTLLSGSTQDLSKALPSVAHMQR